MEITEEKLRDIFTEQRVVIREDVNHLLEILKNDLETKQRVAIREDVNHLLEILKNDLETKQRIAIREEANHILGIMKEDIYSKIELIGEQYGTLKEMIGLLTEDMQTVKTELHIKVDKDEHLALKKRVTVLETKVKA